MSVAPTSAIEQRLAALVPRVRALRVARGVCQLLVVAFGTTSAILLLDAAFPLPAWVRGLYLSVWLTAVGVLAWRWVFVPWRAEIPLADVARELEKHLPELGERLREVVTDDTAGTSAAVRNAVAEDAVRRTKAVDLAQAIPVKQIARHTAVAAVALVAVLATVTLVPGSSDRIRRVALPWARSAPATFRIVVRSGEQVVRRGDRVTLSAYAESIASSPHRSAPPTDAMLILRDKVDSPETRIPMTADGGAFHLTLPPVAADFEYCVEIGSNRSEWFRISALDAVDLAEGTRIEITPPAYTKRPKQTLSELGALDGFQFSTVNFQLKFVRPAAAAHLEWKPDGATKSEVLSLDLAPDRLGATGTFSLTAIGTLRLVLVREVESKKLRTEYAVSVHADRDRPPWFEEMSGVTVRPRTTKPDTRVPISFVVRDDLSVSNAVLEYVLDTPDTKSVPIPITLVGSGTPTATGRIDLDLAGKLRLGETIRFRIRVTDNRACDDPKLTPQEAVYPPNGWSELKLDANASPLEQQDIICQRDALHEGLSFATQALREAATEADALRTDTAGRNSLTVDQAVRLNNAREKVREAIARLQSAARDTALTLVLRPLADAIRVLIDRQLKTAEDSFRTAETDDPTIRKDAFTVAHGLLTDAASKLDEIGSRNGKLANERLDCAKLDTLASDQTALAESLEAGGVDLVAKQRELLSRLTTMTTGSDPLRLSADAAKGEEARRLATSLGELATRLRELDTTAKQTATDTRTALVAAITRDQDALTKRAASTLARLDTPARLAGVALPAPDDFRRVADLAAAGRTVEALTELEKLSLALDRIATAFEKWQTDRIDPKLAAKQLALWQDDLLSRVRVASKAGGFDKLPDEAKTALRSEQKTIHAAVESLALPPDDGVKLLRESAAFRTSRARECLAAGGAGVEEAMKLAVEALIRLSERTPTVGERLMKSLREFDKLRQDLEAAGNAIDLILKGYDKQPLDASTPAAIAKKAGTHADKQRRLIAQVAALDLPGLSERQARVVLALRVAIADLQEGSPFDVQASQLWARREFERLKLVLEGHPSPDVKAEELYRKLIALSNSLGQHLTKQQLEPALPVLQDAWRVLAVMVTTEAPVLLNDARNAVQSAEVAFRDGKPDEIRGRIRLAAEAVGRLSDRLHGAESDLERVNRLAASRRLGAEKPKEVVTSDEAHRQLGRELDELTATRVGAAGHTLKRRALDLYAKLRAKTDPDRVGTDLKLLATTLDELAAKMADVAELAIGISSAASLPPADVDQFLPSKGQADELRELAKQQRSLHVLVTNLPNELTNRLRPTATNPLATVETKQLAIAAEALALAKQLGSGAAANAAADSALAANRLQFSQVRSAKEAAEHAANFFRQLATTGVNKPWGKQAEELITRQDAVVAELSALLDSPGVVTAHQIARTNDLARLSSEFGAQLARAAKSFGPDDATGAVLAEAAKLALEASKRLTEAGKHATNGLTAEAEKQRAAADGFLRAAEKLAVAAPPAVPPGVNPAPGLAVRSAEASMRLAIEALIGEDTDRAQKAMRDAAAALQAAAKAVGK